MSLSTRKIPPTSISKTFKPGNVIASLIGINHEPDKFNDGAIIVKLQIEGPDLGEGFEGFFKDPTNQAKGRYKGQIGTVGAGQYSFRDGEVNGRKIERDVEVLRFLLSLAKALGKEAEINAIETDTIEQYIDAAAPILSKGDVSLHWCLGGKEYEKGGYTNYNLFLAKPTKDEYKEKLAAFSVLEDEVIRFDAQRHIAKKKKDAEQAVEQFEPAQVSEFEIPPIDQEGAF